MLLTRCAARPGAKQRAARLAAVGGEWLGSNLVVNANAGADGKFGDPDDTEGSAPDAPHISRIAKIVIDSGVNVTPDRTDHCGFVANEIGEMKVAGVAQPLTTGQEFFTPAGHGDTAVREVG